MLLLVGYGNTLRSDDGVGPKVVEAIAALKLAGVETLICDLLTPEVADPISHAETVVIVDAAIDGSAEVQLRRLSPADSAQIMAHAADPRTVLALARDVFGHTPAAWWLTIPVKDIGIGEHFSDLACKGVGRAIQKILDLQRACNKADQAQTSVG